ncbi:class I SAM-dependent methyltransferase [Comamonadaceae bacterium G21597-S1]|nr:class I SAM-dependent methyltransferase [Comamonadaceae bacterium G21597-S1]
MSADLPPSIDPRAAQRWAQHMHAASPWLHEEIGRRMHERLQWIRLQPRTWVDWEPLRGGLQAHDAVARTYAGATRWIVEPTAPRRQAVEKVLQAPWWRPARWSAPALRFGEPPPASADMVWANMALHMAADPRALLGQWHRMLAHDGFLMFSCLGPDTLVQLRAAYRAMGWPEPAHVFTDMHDWGDMLVAAGYAEPVMDMERLTLTYASPQRLLDELRGLGRNLQPHRFPGLRGRRWQAQLWQALSGLGGGPAGDGPLELTFEVVYGHALKPQPRLPVQGETVLSLDDMRRVLQQGKRDPAQTR